MLLSICIATYNRARFIGETLDFIIPQLRPGVEIVIVDGNSTDETNDVVSDYSSRCPYIRYFREPINSGFDRDLDKSVIYAEGGHCWLLSDDDFVHPSAINQILNALEEGAVDVLIIEHDVIDASLKRMLRTDRLPFRGERVYRPEDADTLLAHAATMASFVGSAIIRRELWMSRDRDRYFDSMFVHVGVIFQAPFLGRVKLLTASLVTMRAGNAMWRPRSFEIWGFRWPALIWGFDGYAEQAKRRVTLREPWRNLVWLMAFRALGAYSIAEYKVFFSHIRVGPWRIILFLTAIFPGRLSNFLAIMALALLGRGGGDRVYDLTASSRFSNTASRILASLWLGDLTYPAR